MTNTKLRLLLLSAGSLSAQNVIAVLGNRRERCVIIGTNNVAEAAGNFRCDIAYLVPAAASGAAYVERMIELIREERPDLVIPCRDDDVLALAIAGERSSPSDAVLLTGTVEAARITHDKVETARFARRHDLPFAPTAENVREALELAKDHRLPLIGKPRSGSASHGVVLLRSIAEIERAFELRPDLIAQPFLDPPANMDALIAPFQAGLPFFFSFPETRQYFVEIIIGPDGEISNPFGTQGTLVGGQGIEGRRCDDPALLEIGRAYALAMAAEGFKGPLNVQLKRTPEGGLAAFELNGRLNGGTASRALMGFDEVGEVMHRFLPTVVFPSIPAAETDVVQKYLCSYPIPREGLAALRTFGRWPRGSPAVRDAFSEVVPHAGFKPASEASSMSFGVAPSKNVALPNQSLAQSAHVAHRLAIEHCQHAIGGDCTWYHGTWQYLRALGVLKTAGGHARFFGDTLRALATGGRVRRLLISGAADDAMAQIALEAFREVNAPLDLTVVDRCETPLALSRWSAEQVGATVDTCRADMLDFAAETQFDVVMTSSFLAFIEPTARPRLFAHWASLLRTGGKLLFTNRLRPSASDAPVGFTADQAQKFCTRVRHEAERWQEVLGLDPATVEGWTREYTARLRAFPLRSVDEVLELLQTAGFLLDRLDTALFPGMPGGETVAGPSSADRADYVRVLATRV